MFQFPIQALMSFEKCYNFLLGLLHPMGLHCPDGHLLAEGQKPHKFRKNRLPCYRCHTCGKVFNIFTGTVLQGIHYDCITIVLILRGFAKGETTQMLSKELKISYNALLDWRHLLQEFAFENRDVSRLVDKVVESDEVFQNAGEKGVLHADEEDPPRVRANKKKGLGTYENDRPPIQGFFGRQSKQIRLAVCLGARINQIQPKVESQTQTGCQCYTDEAQAYNRVASSGRKHATVNHSAKEFARDDDGDGINEVHCNSCEGLWTGLRNFLRPFRGINKRYLAQYVAVFENAFNFKEQLTHIIRAMILPDYFLEIYSSP